MRIDKYEFDFSRRADEIKENEIVKNKETKLKALFNIFDKNNDHKLDKDEINAAFELFDNWDVKSYKTGKSDNKITNREILNGLRFNRGDYEKLNDDDFAVYDVREFMVRFFKLNTKKGKPSEDIQEPTSSTVPATPTVPGKPIKHEPDENGKYDYVIPEGQSFKQLLKKILAKQGKTEPTEQDLKDAEEQFRKDNPDTEIRERKGVKYLLVGSRVKVPVDFEEELCDPEKEIEKWKIRVGLLKKPSETQEPTTPTTPTSPSGVQEPTTPTTPTSPSGVQEPTTPTAPTAPSGVQEPTAPTTPTTPATPIEPETKEQAAEKMGLRKTFSDNFYYNEKEKMHYQWIDGQFMACPNIIFVNKDGSYYSKYKNDDGSSKLLKSDKNDRPLEMYALNYQNKVYVNCKYAAEKLGLSETKASENKQIYYDENTKTYLKWDDKSHCFKTLGSDVKLIDMNGGTYGKNAKIKTTTVYDIQNNTIKEYIETITENGKTTINKYDSDKKIKFSSVPNSYGGKTESKYNKAGKETDIIIKDKTGRIIRKTHKQYDSNNECVLETKRNSNSALIGRKYKDTETGKIKYEDGEGTPITEEEYNNI